MQHSNVRWETVPLVAESNLHTHCCEKLIPIELNINIVTVKDLIIDPSNSSRSDKDFKLHFIYKVL